VVESSVSRSTRLQRRPATTRPQKAEGPRWPDSTDLELCRLHLPKALSNAQVGE
jgi:hypothetical protein